MIRTRDDYKSYLAEDKVSLNVKPGLKAWLFDDIWKYQRQLRRTEYYSNKLGFFWKLVAVLHLIRLRKIGRTLGFSIPINVFGPGLSLAHAGTVVVNSNCKIGTNCRVHVCVNIGADISNGKLAPRLGNNCYIGPGVKMYGDILIGNNVVIGANAVVNKSFPDNVTIAGVPAKVISHKGRTEYRS